MFIWDETDFYMVLEVEPRVEDSGEFYLYVVEKDGLRLEVGVFPFIGDVSIILYRNGQERPLLRWSLAQCSGARRVQDESGEFLKIGGAQSFGGYYDAEASIPFGVRVAVNPSVSIALI